MSYIRSVALTTMTVLGFRSGCAASQAMTSHPVTSGIIRSSILEVRQRLAAVLSGRQVQVASAQH